MSDDSIPNDDYTNIKNILNGLDHITVTDVYQKSNSKGDYAEFILSVDTSTFQNPDVRARSIVSTVIPAAMPSGVDYWYPEGDDGIDEIRFCTSGFNDNTENNFGAHNL